ncbi:hypothetical protein ADEAN_000144900 [Angomonas deanei]|uniref:Uncharacterized protein n=1 Tax=Angomonas deanei TaxID=59799 RepID=A0A7G2C3B8_9TRYP|nr:hypothetical protein ADEAN_000144900 [Angomonas deanei]
MYGVAAENDGCVSSVVQLEYKLGRCLSALGRSDDGERHRLLRRLGALRLSALESLSTPPSSSDVESSRKRFPEVFETLMERVNECDRVLAKELEAQLNIPLIPLDAIGAPYADKDGLLIIDPVSASRVTVSTTVDERLIGGLSPVNSAPHAAPPKREAQSGAAPIEEPTVDGALLKDIKMAVRQMKEGAMKMNEIMEGEKESFLLSETLLSSNIDKNQKNMRDIDKIDGARHRPLPSFLRRIPGMAFMWSQLIIPLWESVKHAIYLLIVVLITFFMLFLMLTASRPRKYIHTVNNADPPVMSEPVAEASNQTEVEAVPPRTDTVAEQDQTTIDDNTTEENDESETEESGSDEEWEEEEEEEEEEQFPDTNEAEPTGEEDTENADL